MPTHPRWSATGSRPRHRRRRLLVPCALVLALITGALLGQTWDAFAPAAPPVAPDAAVARVRAWYAAADRVLAAGDADAFAGLLAPGFIDHAATGDGDAAALAGALLALRATHPEARLVPLDLAAADDRVVARVRVDGAERGNFLGLPVDGVRVWGAVDVFRVVPGGIVEHWGDGQPLATFAPMADVVVPNAATAATAILTRRRFQPGGTEVLAAVGGFAVVAIEAGALDFTPDRLVDGRAWLIGRAPGERRAVAAGQEAGLAPGAVLLLENGGMGRLRNGGTNAAAALVLTVGAPQPDVLSQTGGGSPGAQAAAARAPSPEGAAAVATTVLAGGQRIALPVGPLAVAIGRAVLPPGSEIAAHAVVGAELVAVEVGQAALTADGPSAWVATGQGGTGSDGAAPLLGPGTGALAAGAGAGGSVLSAGDEPATLTLVVIAAAPTP